VAYPIQFGAHSKELIAESQFKSISDHFLYNFKNKISAGSMRMEDLSVDITYDPC
jgi:hypothetical protein